MADWKLLLSKVLLADGMIDAAEAKLLSKEILADGSVDDEEMEFLVGLRSGAKKPGDAFEDFFFEALTSNVLADGKVDTAEAKRLQAILYADGAVDAREKAFLRNLKRKAKATCPEFESLYKKAVGG